MKGPVDLAIVGGYGDVGAEAARHWLRLRGRSRQTVRLRIGGRDADAADAFALNLSQVFELPQSAITATRVDLFDAESLDRFVAGARVVLNAAGPSHRIGDRVARSALRADADYVDAAGDDALHAVLVDGAYTDAHRCAVLSAGMQPGMSGLLPRWLAARMSRPRRLLSHIGVLDRFTHVAADDFLQGGVDGNNDPLAAWRHGPRKRVLQRSGTRLIEGFPEPVTLLPYLDREGERVAEALGLDHGDWYSAVEGRHVMDAFDRAHTLSRDEAVATLCRASALDLGGRRTRVILRMQLDGEDSTRSVLLQASGNAVLSGAFAAATCMAVRRGEVAPGRHFAANVLDPVDTLDTLCAIGAFEHLVAVDGPVALLQRDEEGVL